MDDEDRTITSAQRSDDFPPAWEPRAITRARGLSELLDRRPELSGVYKPADVTAEGVRWSA
ncbi:MULTISPECIES: hypothetical protein [unclassified Nocardioides]|uniref:hypothetical protein n=1 Tax=unclassified Nocardioides TaxID=2615069 RepID=UPI0036102603